MIYQDDDWELLPLEDSETGEAFMGIRQDEKVFLKRNTSPFTTALSAKGFTPKLMWTQRTYSGDTLTAQEWKDGRLLTNEEMDRSDVIDTIRRYHHSEDLLAMLKRVGGEIYRPVNFIEYYYKDLPSQLQAHRLFNEVITFLEDSVEESFYHARLVVCHGDLHHNNFLWDEENQHLYLVDWENVHISDPLSDITNLLVRYIRPSDWTRWLEEYGYDFDEEAFYERVRWYSLINILYFVKQYHGESRHYKMNEMILLLKQIYEN
ncbi:phosphotransferase [Suicoccus acidiformans]|uniref:Phosphotransferase n=1 Tax=Suicoccus acidiformans TaxID=2036206 RepID=A0A347WJ55_9LACT|nr:phosphotransferase family protein [Suicoccus acidiformans]AXY25112.1 phosphotransferase [Suicoccus acidiformans]